MSHSLIPKPVSKPRHSSDAHGAPDSRWNSVRAILDAIPDPAWVTTLKGQVRLANRAASECYGFLDEEWKGQDIAALIGCDETGFNSIERILAEEGYYFFESRHQCKNGRTFQGEARLTLANVQRAAVCIVIAGDNTQRHEAETAYRKSQERFKKIFDHAATGMNIIVPEGYFLQSNPAFCKFVGYSREELQGITVSELTHPDDLDNTARIMAEICNGERRHVYLEKRFLHKSGKVVWGAVSATWIAHPDGSPEYGITLVQDITESRHVRQKLLASEQQYRLVVNNVRDVFFQLNAEGRFCFLNAAWENLTGLDIQESLGASLEEFISVGQEDCLESLLAGVQSGQKESCREELQFSFPQRPSLWLELELLPADEDGLTTGSLHDISTHKQNQAALEQERIFLQTIIDGVVDPLLVVDLDYRVMMMNQAARNVGQGSGGQGAHCYQLFHHQDGPCCDDYHPCPLEEVKQTGQPVTVVHYHIDQDGQQKIFEVQASPYRDHSGELRGVIESSRDITYLFEAEEQLREKETRLDYLVQHDALTDLPNRTSFYVRLRQAMQRAVKNETRAAVLLLDLDRFKNINESLGHDLGDRILCEVAKRLCLCLRDTDMVARAGGDEFVIILEGIQDLTHIDVVARKVMTALSPLIELDGYQLFVTGSLGISVFPEDGADAATLMKAADISLFRAKDNGRNTYQFYTPDMSARSREMLLLESSLRKGIEQEQLVLHYQPQIDLFTGHITGMEALVRWNHPQRGMISPADFIPLAEETGLIVPMGEWVLREACRQNRHWQQLGFSPIRMTVNISARQFLKGDLVQMIADTLEETRLDSRYLELEITESMIMNDVESAIFIMAQLAELGVNLAIDDFGTGYSSLAHLKRFPLTTLKIDRAFVKDLTTNDEDEAIVRAIVALAHSLNLQVIAEGIETAEQCQFLKEHGCEQGQGFLFSKPQAAGKIRGFLRPGASG